MKCVHHEMHLVVIKDIGIVDHQSVINTRTLLSSVCLRD